MRCTARATQRSTEGLPIDELATFDAATNEFVLNSPSQGAFKNWISQGHVADQAVVFCVEINQ